MTASCAPFPKQPLARSRELIPVSEDSEHHQQEAQHLERDRDGGKQPNSPQRAGPSGHARCTVTVPGGLKPKSIAIPSRLWPLISHLPPPKPFRAFHHPMPPSYNPCPVAARLRLRRRVPGLGPGLTNTDCVFHPAAPVTHSRHPRHLHHNHHHLHRKRQQPPAVLSITTFPLRPRSPLRPAPSTLCIAQSPFATMASATSFYDFKPVDSKLCQLSPLIIPRLHPYAPLYGHRPRISATHILLRPWRLHAQLPSSFPI